MAHCFTCGSSNHNWENHEHKKKEQYTVDFDPIKERPEEWYWKFLYIAFGLFSVFWIFILLKYGFKVLLIFFNSLF